MQPKYSTTPSQPLCHDFWCLSENILYRVLQRRASSSNFFIRSLQMSDAFYKSSFFLNNLTFLSDGDQLLKLLMRCTSVRVSSILLLHNNETFRVLLQNSGKLIGCRSHNKCVAKHLKPWSEQFACLYALAYTILWQRKQYSKSQTRQLWVWFTQSWPEPRKWHFIKNITCSWIIPKITKLVL